MHALFFEMRPKPGHLDHYFDHVARLRPVLAKHEGLAFLDRYGSVTDPGLILSHQLWDSEEAIVAWRGDAEHRRSQIAGNKVHFADYRIRVGERLLHLRQADPGPADLPDRGHRFVLAIYGTRPVPDPNFSTFKSFNFEDRYVSLASHDTGTGIAAAITALGTRPGIEEIAAYGIRRDYGQFDRAEAPQ